MFLLRTRMVGATEAGAAMDSASEPKNDSSEGRESSSQSLLRDFPDRAIRWLLESPDNVRGLLNTAAPGLADRFDVSKLRQEKCTFVQESLRKRETDCILRAPFRSGDGASERDVWIYILIEHQSDRDPWMAYRLLKNMFALWESETRAQEDCGVPASERRLSAIVPIVLYTGQRPWERLGSFADLVDVPKELEAFVPRHDSVFFSVSTSDPRTLTASGDLLGYVLLLFHLSEASTDEVARALREVFAGLERLARAGDLERWYCAARIVVGYIRHRRAPEEVDRLVLAATEAIEDASRGREVRTMARTSAEELIEKGKEIGKEIGREEGRLAEKRETFLRLMRQKFGPLSPTKEAQIAVMQDGSRLDALLARILTAASPEEMGL